MGRKSSGFSMLRFIDTVFSLQGACVEDCKAFVATGSSLFPQIITIIIIDEHPSVRKYAKWPSNGIYHRSYNDLEHTLASKKWLAVFNSRLPRPLKQGVLSISFKRERYQGINAMISSPRVRRSSLNHMFASIMACIPQTGVNPTCTALSGSRCAELRRLICGSYFPPRPWYVSPT